MAFKMKGPTFFGKSPLKYHTKEHKGKDDGNNDGNDDQSKEAAVKKGDACAICGTLKGNHKADHAFTTAAQLNEQDNKELDKKTDAEGKGNGSNRKVMKDGYVNPTQKKKIADEKARFNALTPEQKQAEQDKANDKADKFHKRGKYATKKGLSGKIPKYKSNY